MNAKMVEVVYRAIRTTCTSNELNVFTTQISLIELNEVLKAEVTTFD